MSGTSWDYRSVTWKSGAVPAIPAIIDVRQRALGLLKEMYPDAAAVAAKKSTINAMMAATRLPNFINTTMKSCRWFRRTRLTFWSFWKRD